MILHESSHGGPEGGLPPLPPLKKIWDYSKVEKGPAVPKKVKPTDGDAVTAVRYFILLPPRAIRIILHKKILKSDLTLPRPHLYSCMTQEYGRRTTGEAADARSRLWLFAALVLWHQEYSPRARP